MSRIWLIALACILACRSVLAAGDDSPNHLRFEKLVSRLNRVFPGDQVVPLPGAGNTIILTGRVANQDDVETILRIAHDLYSPEEGVIINGIEVGTDQNVILDLQVVMVNRSGLKDADAGLHTRYAKCFGQLRMVNKAERQECLALLKKIRKINQAVLMGPALLSTKSGKPVTFISGGVGAVPRANGLPHFPDRTQIRFLPIVKHRGIYVELDMDLLNYPNSQEAIENRTVQRVRTTLEVETGKTIVLGMPNVLNAGPQLGEFAADHLALVATVKTAEPMALPDRRPDDFEEFLKSILNQETRPNP